MQRPLPRLFWVFWWGSIVNRMGTVVVTYLTFYLTRERGLDGAEAGLLVALYGLGATLAGWLGGQLADRWGRRPTVLLGLGGGAVVIGLLSRARTVPELTIGVFLLGLVAETYRPAVNAAIADIVPPGDRARAFGLQYWAVNLGFAVAAASGGFLARQGYELLFAVDAATTLAYAALVFLLVPETRPSAATRTGAASGGVLHDALFLVVLGLCLAVSLIFNQAGATMAADMSRLAFDEADYGLALALNGVVIVALQPFATAAIARRRADGSPVLDPARTLAFAATLIGAGFGMYALGTLWGFALGVFIWTVGEILMAPINAGLVAAMAPAAYRGRYQGAFTAAHGIATCAGPLMGTALLGPLGAGVWLLTCFVGVLTALGFAAMGPALRRRVGVNAAPEPS